MLELAAALTENGYIAAQLVTGEVAILDGGEIGFARVIAEISMAWAMTSFR